MIIDGEQRSRWSNWWLVAVPLALIALITAADIVTPSQVHLGPLLVVAPAITASFAGPWLTGAIGLVAVAAQALIGAREDTLDTQGLQVQLLAVTVMSAFVVLFRILRDRDRRKLVQVRSVSEAAQRALLRPLPRQAGPLRLASHYLAAEAEAHIGGDLYGAIRTDGGTRLIIGDARGKGLSAVSDAALLLGAFREAARRCPTLPELAADLDESASFNMESADEGESFVTAVMLDIADDDPACVIVNCGHPPPLLIHGGDVELIDSELYAPPLGLGGLAASRVYTAQACHFEVGDILLLYTDGVVEARDPAGRFYPLDERITAWTGCEPQALLERICADLVGYVGGHLGDDAAMVAIERLPHDGIAVASAVARPRAAELNGHPGPASSLGGARV
ncbi:PP2C family protein-serine/threonine phosphatase [Nonomuraea sp. NPDC000554]|uniref:PP2C family protein-serine/threonine phosphatase n=1 Tax=Nonomuraea sp. NPDC000554 TaxID=3154259 RepID=UPI00331A0C17